MPKLQEVLIQIGHKYFNKQPMWSIGNSPVAMQVTSARPIMSNSKQVVVDNIFKNSDNDVIYRGDLLDCLFVIMMPSYMIVLLSMLIS